MSMEDNLEACYVAIVLWKAVLANVKTIYEWKKANKNSTHVESHSQPQPVFDCLYLCV